MKEIFVRFPEGHSCYTPLLFGYRGGTRIGEAFAFCWDDIDFANGQIDINKQVQWYKDRQQWRIVPPKYDSYRKIDMDRETMAYLKRERQRQLQFRLGYGKAYVRLYADSEGYINADGNGNEIQMVTVRCDGSYIQPRVMQHCSKVIHQELGCPAFDFHSLRHTFVTIFLLLFSFLTLHLQVLLQYLYYFWVFAGHIVSKQLPNMVLSSALHRRVAFN